MEKYKLRSVIKKKKGGLDVSVNSIVVLIFAVIILSLGIAFIKNMFGKATKQFTNVDAQVKADMQKTLASSSKRVVLSKTDGIELTPGGEAEDLYIGIKNYFDSDEVFGVLAKENNLGQDGSLNSEDSTISCFDASPDNGGSGTDAAKHIVFRTVSKYKIRSGDSAVLKVLVEADQNAPTGVYFCKAAIVNPKDTSKVYGEVPLTVTVKSS